MKKLFITLIALLIPICTNAAENNTVLNLHTEKSYIVELDSRPIDLQNSNPRAINVSSVTDILPEDSSLIIRTKEEGIAYITFKLKGKQTTIKVLIDDKADEDKNLLILDKPEKPTK